jgi:hypothetical protein
MSCSSLLFARFEDFTAVIFQVEAFWVVVGYQSFRGPCCLYQAARYTEKSVSYHITTRRHNPEDGGSMDLWIFGILPHHYTASQPRRWRQHGPLNLWYPTTSLHGVTTQKISTCCLFVRKVYKIFLGRLILGSFSDFFNWLCYVALNDRIVCKRWTGCRDLF